MTVTCPKCAHEWHISPKRSLDQSRLLHKLIAAYAHAVGEDPAHAKVVFKYWYGESVAYPFETPPEWPGRFVQLDLPYADGPVIVYLKSEAAYSKAEERALIDAVHARCIDVDADLHWMGDYGH